MTKDAPKRTLKEILDSTEQIEEAETDNEQNDEPKNEVEEVDDGLCCECGDQPQELVCLQCDEPFCQVCFYYLHRTGRRREHNVQYTKPIVEILSNKAEVQKDEEMVDSSEPPNAEDVIPEAVDEEEEVVETEKKTEEIIPENSDNPELVVIKKNAAFVPMRLTGEERKLLRLLEAALEVSEYTDRVDIYMYASKAKRIVRELKEICRVLAGLVIANGMETGRDLVGDGDFAAQADWYQDVFEIGRRYKIMNPEKMRSNYGKMAYMIMDSRLPEIRQILDFDLYKPVLTVEQHLTKHGAMALLDDPQLVQATTEIVAGLKSCKQIKFEIKQKERAIEYLTKLYGENVRNAIYSLGDFHGYIVANKGPVDLMIERLKTEFDSELPQDETFSLGISSGRGGARLTHNHRRQYQYVLQSLTLWSQIMSDMYLLWKYADDDLLAETPRYLLEDTGQGLNRVKSSPKVNRTMHSIISRAQRATGAWVGSSVVHLGDRAVPNALFFLDKYLQVPRILNPVNNAMKLLPEVLTADIFATEWADTQFGSQEILLKTILTDFFRYAFDGSGADNFYDAGSCIDGRLTSAWNWANQLPKKKYYKFFLITGFVGFDGTDGF